MLTDSLEGSKYLRILDLSRHGLTDKDLGNLSKVLSTCQLEHLNLGNNNISDQGLAVLASLSIPGGSLQTLDITRNQGCTQEGFCHLLKLVKDNPRLDSLHCQFEEGLSPETRHFLDFNKSGRSLLGQAGHNVPLSLWPVVLERANGIFHDEADHKEKAANVIFHLLQGPQPTGTLLSVLLSEGKLSKDPPSIPTRSRTLLHEFDGNAAGVVGLPFGGRGAKRKREQ
jgi:hypothetical protein